VHFIGLYFIIISIIILVDFVLFKLHSQFFCHHIPRKQNEQLTTHETLKLEMQILKKILS